MVQRVMNHLVHAQVEDGTQVRGHVMRDCHQPRTPVGHRVGTGDSQSLDPALRIGPRKAVSHADGAPGQGCGVDCREAQDLQDTGIVEFAQTTEHAPGNDDAGVDAKLRKAGAKRLGEARHASRFMAARDQDLRWKPIVHGLLSRRNQVACEGGSESSGVNQPKSRSRASLLRQDR